MSPRIIDLDKTPEDKVPLPVEPKKKERKYVPYKFEVFQDVKKEFRFRLKAPNGQIIATSEGYTTKQNCMDTIKSIQKHASRSEIDVKKRFRVNI